MDVLSPVIIVILIGGALTLIFYPLWQQTRPETILRVNRPGQTLEEYQARYQALLTAIKDLMFDYEMGKISTEDYERLLNKTKLEAAEIRRQIDHLEHSTTADIEASLDAEIETLIDQPSHNFETDEALLREVEAEIELLKDVKLDKQPTTGLADDKLTCPHCHKIIQPGDVFCAHCGQSLAELETEFKTEFDADACPKCGYSSQPDDVFCARCGATLKK
jgi:RNA polymerase subunit RPABC4/transcription elongation factor Spt4